LPFFCFSVLCSCRLAVLVVHSCLVCFSFVFWGSCTSFFLLIKITAILFAVPFKKKLLDQADPKSMVLFGWGDPEVMRLVPQVLPGFL
jgi:hypothetical protein